MIQEVVFENKVKLEALPTIATRSVTSTQSQANAHLLHWWRCATPRETSNSSAAHSNKHLGTKQAGQTCKASSSTPRPVVLEVVDDIAESRIHAVLYKTQLGPFPRTREVPLQSRRPGVQHTGTASD